MLQDHNVWPSVAPNVRVLSSVTLPWLLCCDQQNLLLILSHFVFEAAAQRMDEFMNASEIYRKCSNV